MQSSVTLSLALALVLLGSVLVTDARAWDPSTSQPVIWHPFQFEPSVFPRPVDPWKLWGLRGLATAPPAIHRRAVAPRHATWIPAGWAWDGSRWVWVDGHWEWGR